MLLSINRSMHATVPIFGTRGSSNGRLKESPSADKQRMWRWRRCVDNSSQDLFHQHITDKHETGHRLERRMSSSHKNHWINTKKAWKRDVITIMALCIKQETAHPRAVWRRFVTTIQDVQTMAVWSVSVEQETTQSEENWPGKDSDALPLWRNTDTLLNDHNIVPRKKCNGGYTMRL